MKNTLRMHERVHTGESNFQCKECGKYFNTGWCLKAHANVHTKERPFKCQLCDKSYSASGGLHFHMKKKHPDATVKLDYGPLKTQKGENGDKV